MEFDPNMIAPERRRAIIALKRHYKGYYMHESAMPDFEKIVKRAIVAYNDAPRRLRAWRRNQAIVILPYYSRVRAINDSYDNTRNGCDFVIEVFTEKTGPRTPAGIRALVYNAMHKYYTGQAAPDLTGEPCIIYGRLSGDKCAP